MPWNSTYYPTSMKNLPPILRGKAIKIANALLEEGMDEGKPFALLFPRQRSGRVAIWAKASLHILWSR